MTTKIFDVIYTVNVPDYAEAIQAPLELFSKDASEIAKYYAVVKHKSK